MTLLSAGDPEKASRHEGGLQVGEKKKGLQVGEKMKGLLVI